MREISTESLKVGEHIIVDGVEYVAKDGTPCDGCDLFDCGRCFLVPCQDGLILKRVEKQPTETHDKDTLMTNLQLAEWLAKGHGQAQFYDTAAIFSVLTFREGEENEAVNEDLFIRPWNETEWVRPTVGIYRRDCT